MAEDHGPGVRVPPPAIVLAALGLTWLLQRLIPIQLGPPAPAFGFLVMFLAMAWVGWALLAQAWRLPKSTFEIVRGGTAREKTLMVAGDPALLADRIAEWMRKNG